MTQNELATVETSCSNSVEARSTTTTPKENKAWHFPLKLVIAFVEALGRGSEEFYVYLPLALEPRNQETPNP
jgi:hypothetical protein